VPSRKLARVLRDAEAAVEFTSWNANPTDD
jgi:hypothetical protein